MGPKTMMACLQDKLNRHRLTIPKYIIKQAARALAAAAKCDCLARPKARRKPNRKKPVAYKRLDDERRIQIETLFRQGFSQAGIARATGCHPSTISRELARNKSQRGYRHGKAQKKADRRANEKAAARRKLTPEIWQDAKEKLEEGWTFEQISERAKRDGKPTVSKETFYNEYYRSQRLVSSGASTEELPPLPRRRKLRKTRDRNAKKYRNAWTTGKSSPSSKSSATSSAWTSISRSPITRGSEGRTRTETASFAAFCRRARTSPTSRRSR